MKANELKAHFRNKAAVVLADHVHVLVVAP